MSALLIAGVVLEAAVFAVLFTWPGLVPAARNAAHRKWCARCAGKGFAE